MFERVTVLARCMLHAPNAKFMVGDVLLSTLFDHDFVHSVFSLIPLIKMRPANGFRVSKLTVIASALHTTVEPGKYWIFWQFVILIFKFCSNFFFNILWNMAVVFCIFFWELWKKLLFYGTFLMIPLYLLGVIFILALMN